MNNVEQILRLLEELERLDHQDDHDSIAPAVTSSALLKALVENDFNLTTAILGVRSDS
jgi:hypothetical protein